MKHSIEIMFEKSVASEASASANDVRIRFGIKHLILQLPGKY